MHKTQFLSRYGNTEKNGESLANNIESEGGPGRPDPALASRILCIDKNYTLVYGSNQRLSSHTAELADKAYHWRVYRYFIHKNNKC